MAITETPPAHYWRSQSQDDAELTVDSTAAAHTFTINGLTIVRSVDRTTELAGIAITEGGIEFNMVESITSNPVAVPGVGTTRIRHLLRLLRRGQRMTDEINADPNEVARLRLSRLQAREGMVRWDPEEGDNDAK
jgi:hypothetical protein